MFSFPSQSCVNHLMLMCTCLLALCTQSVMSEVSNLRVEPPNWWVGMQRNELQIMLHADQIGSLVAEVDAEGVAIERTERRENPNYLWLYLTISDSAPAQSAVFRLRSTESKEVKYEFRYDFRTRVKGSANRKGFSAKDVIYLLMPDRFANGNPDNDEIENLYEGVDRSNPDGRHGGDLQGITQHLDYLHQLGITQIWLNPVQENNQEKYSYHGYSISDLYNVDARLGGNDALIELAEQAQTRGMGIIMDTIPNHIGLNHWWMRDLPTQNWVNHIDQPYLQTTHRREVIQDPNAAEIDKYEHNNGWFVPTMPDLNQHEILLADYLIQNNVWWIETVGLSGMRIDTLPYGDKNFTQRFNQQILAEYPDFNLVGEEWSVNPAIVSYWQRGKLNQDGFDGWVPSLMDFPLQEALVKGLKDDLSYDGGIAHLYRGVANDFQYPNPMQLVVIADNHDMSRIFTQLDEDYQRYQMALVFLATTRGIPQLFYGTEILMTNPGTDAHGVIRTDFPGGWGETEFNAFTGRGLSTQAKEAQRFVTQLLNWRKSAEAVHKGKLVHFAPAKKGGVYVYFRVHEKQKVMVVINPSEKSHQLNWSRYSEVIGQSTEASSVLTDANFSTAKAIEIAAKSAHIFELSH
ncbi:MAG: glycoside hydrolase family 13 protein [Pseudomonadota bacterium]